MEQIADNDLFAGKNVQAWNLNYFAYMYVELEEA